MMTDNQKQGDGLSAEIRQLTSSLSKFGNRLEALERRIGTLDKLELETFVSEERLRREREAAVELYKSAQAKKWAPWVRPVVLGVFATIGAVVLAGIGWALRAWQSSLGGG